jgi:peptidoglycan hydrolase-like protein with peptidoglycan-binding domain
VAVAAAAVLGGAAAAAAAGIGVTGGESPSRTVPSPTTADVTRETLVDYEEVAGELGYGKAAPLRYIGPPSPGSGEAQGAAGERAPATSPPATSPPATSPPAASPPAPEPPAPEPPAPEAPPTTRPPATTPPPSTLPDDGLGLITWLPAVGSVTNRGEPLFRVDNEPVVLLYGALPLFRTLAAGVEGPDVRQLEENLVALGYTGFTVDDSFTEATAAAVRRWQAALDVPETGAVAPGALLYHSGRIRIAAHTLGVGDTASGEILSYTGTVRKVTAALPVSKQRYATEGTEATVILADGSEVTATVERTDETPTETGDAAAGLPGGEPVVEITAAFADQDELGDQREGPVRVRFVAQQREDVLTVPVIALVALVEGGYGVEVVEGSTSRYVAVETGMFARGRVEITAGELQAGMKVVVPS